jgi:3-dehydroquinate synthase
MIVRHSGGSYRISFAQRSELAALADVCSAIVTDRNVRGALDMCWPSLPTYVLTPGEVSKSLRTYGEAIEWLAAQGLRRNDRLAVIGGGVVGDLGGFVAASYLRGIDYVQVPTSLLAMVDSSIGGKVGIDLAAGKNLAGAFHPPVEVLIPFDALETLPSRHRRNGLAEIWKYAFIADPMLAGRIESEGASQSVVHRCIEIKQEIVEADEFETTGARATLNFGHTIGHAIEAALGYEELLHGEAISIGMVLESDLGEAIGATQSGVANAVRECLQAAGLPTKLPDVPVDTLIEFMRRDKKRSTANLAFSLLTRIGECKLVTEVDEAAVRAVLERR